MRVTATALRRRLAGEGGFTMIAVVSTLAVLVAFSLAAFATVNGDVALSGEDVTRKQALAAAEAGVADYLFHVNQNNAYWTQCTNVALPNAVNQTWNGSGTDTRTRWRSVPGETTQYAIELLPARGSGYSQCTPGTNVAASMLDANRTLRIRSTGRATGAGGQVKRSIIATLKRTSFLDFLYFTDYETSDPVWYARLSKGRPTYPTDPDDGDLLTWAGRECVRYYRDAPAGAPGDGFDRPSPRWSGRWDDDGDGDRESQNVDCTDMDIQFAPHDVVAGPLHTNDELWTCGSPTFGRTAADRIESGHGYRPVSSCGAGTPRFLGTWAAVSGKVEMPPTDATLAQIASPSYTFSGRTEIRLGEGGITVNGVAKAYPSNGVIYVRTGESCGHPYNPLNPENEPTGLPAGCANVWLSGRYDHDLTIATQNDIIIDGDVVLDEGSDARLGLIADNYVRIRHPVVRTSASDPTQCRNPNAGDGKQIVGNRRVDAAILSLAHSFMVDNYYCGATLGTLTVKGVIAQKFRGPVGRLGGGSVVNGYVKNYSYDDRLSFRGPPHFLDPVQSSWKVRSYTEQLPAR